MIGRARIRVCLSTGKANPKCQPLPIGEASTIIMQWLTAMKSMVKTNQMIQTSKLLKKRLVPTQSRGVQESHRETRGKASQGELPLSMSWATRSWSPPSKSSNQTRWLSQMAGNSDLSMLNAKLAPETPAVSRRPILRSWITRTLLSNTNKITSKIFRSKSSKRSP